MKLPKQEITILDSVQKAQNSEKVVIKALCYKYSFETLERKDLHWYLSNNAKLLIWEQFIA